MMKYRGQSELLRSLEWLLPNSRPVVSDPESPSHTTGLLESFQWHIFFVNHFTSLIFDWMAGQITSSERPLYVNTPDLFATDSWAMYRDMFLTLRCFASLLDVRRLDETKTPARRSAFTILHCPRSSFADVYNAPLPLDVRRRCRSLTSVNVIAC